MSGKNSIHCGKNALEAVRLGHGMMRIKEIAYSHLFKRIQLIRPINLDMRNILCRKRDVEKLLGVSVRHLVVSKLTNSPCINSNVYLCFPLLFLFLQPVPGYTFWKDRRI